MTIFAGSLTGVTRSFKCRGSSPGFSYLPVWRVSVPYPRAPSHVLRSLPGLNLTSRRHPTTRTPPPPSFLSLGRLLSYDGLRTRAHTMLFPYTVTTPSLVEDAALLTSSMSSPSIPPSCATSPHLPRHPLVFVYHRLLHHMQVTLK
jgi:hypothetical protein